MGRLKRWLAFALPTTGACDDGTAQSERIAEYDVLGIDEFILAGHPHLEEAYGFAEGVLPLLRG